MNVNVITQKIKSIPKVAWIVIGAIVLVILYLATKGKGSTSSLGLTGGGGGGSSVTTPVLPAPTPTPTPDPILPRDPLGIPIITPSPGNLPGGTIWSSPAIDAAAAAGGIETPTGANAYWNNILETLRGMDPTENVGSLFPASQAVPNSGSPEVNATAGQYQNLVLGQAAVNGGVIDVLQGYTDQQRLNELAYLQDIQRTGAYNPNLAAISSPAAVASLIASMQQSVPAPSGQGGTPTISSGGTTDPGGLTAARINLHGAT